MSTEANKEVARRMVDLLNKDNWAELLRAEVSDPSVEEFIAEHADFRAAFPDYQFIIEDLIAEGDKVVIRGTVRATHCNEFPVAELKGIAATGKQLEWTEVSILRFEEDQIVDGWFLLDGVSRLQQLGVLPHME